MCSTARSAADGPNAAAEATILSVESALATERLLGLLTRFTGDLGVDVVSASVTCRPPADEGQGDKVLIQAGATTRAELLVQLRGNPLPASGHREYAEALLEALCSLEEAHERNPGVERIVDPGLSAGDSASGVPGSGTAIHNG